MPRAHRVIYTASYAAFRWKAHTASYAARQIAAYEVPASLGWSFGAWKLSAAREAELSEYVSRRVRFFSSLSFKPARCR